MKNLIVILILTLAACSYKGIEEKPKPMKVVIVKLSEIVKDPTMRLDAAYWIKKKSKTKKKKKK